MLKRLQNLSSNVSNIIMYVPSPSFGAFIKDQLRDVYAVHRDFIVNVDTAKALRTAKLDSVVAPMLCDNWLIHVDAEKLPLKEVTNALNFNTAYGVTVYWTDRYYTYKRIIDTNTVKKLGVHCIQFPFSRLGYSDVKILYDKMVGDKKSLSDELLDYVAKTYRYDVQAVCELFQLVKSGSEFTTKREIIEAVGVGGNSVGSLTISILQAGLPNRFSRFNKGSKAKKKVEGFSSEKSRQNALGRALRLIDDLSVSYKHSTIKRYMINTVEAFIDMKQLQIMGVYGRPNTEIPNTFDTKRLAMNRRFEHIVLRDITLPRLLNLKMCLTAFDNFDAEIALIQAISKYFSSIPLSK